MVFSGSAANGCSSNFATEASGFVSVSNSEDDVEVVVRGDVDELLEVGCGSVCVEEVSVDVVVVGELFFNFSL